MRRIGFLCVLAPCLGGLLAIGCSKDAPPANQPAHLDSNTPNPLAIGENGATPVPVVAGPADQNYVQDGVVKSLDALLARPPELSIQEKYNAALLDALNLTADHKYSQALASLETARALQDTEQIRQEIDRLKGLADQQAAADRTVQDIQTVLSAGKSDEAARLAAAALQQYGASDAAEPLTSLKRQADALVGTQLDQETRRTRFREEGEAALRDQNLRGAAIAFEQSLQEGEDPDLHRRVDDLHTSLARYDDSRKRAAELRRDPANLEVALDALKEAAAAWDTREVRQEIDEYTLALNQRRERVGVADFEVRGEVGIPDAGRAIADELLPALKPRFDLVERGQLGKVIDELKLDTSDLVENQGGRSEIGRLAKMRYLVVGSVSSLEGITVNARLVDVRSGLVVQTAKLVASSPEELIPRLPELANLLMMTDDQKIAYEQQLAARVPPLVCPVELAPLPPPPEMLVASQPPPPPVLVYSPRPPDFGGLQAQDFDQLPPPGQGPPPEVIGEREEPVRQRLLQVSVQLGDNLFLRGRFQEAHTQFELALNLSPDRDDLRIRVDRCRPHLPPPPVVVVAPPPPSVIVVGPAEPPPVLVMAPPPRPRIAILNFVVNADSDRAPPGFGDWAADQIASYFTPAYEIVDRGELFWYMGRLGLTQRDVLMNVGARRWLGRALHVRFFVFGVVQQTASFNVTTHLIDSETDTKQGGGMIHVKDQQELKLRLGELAQQTRQAQADPAAAARLQEEAKENEQQVNTARRLVQEGHYAEAIAACQDGLKRRPDNVALQALLQQAQQKVQESTLAEARRRALEQQQAEAAAVKQRQQQLAQQVEAARLRAAQEAAARNEAALKAQAADRQRAYDQLVAQAQQALQKGDYQQSIHLLESAVALKPDPQGQQLLASARAKAVEGAHTQAAAEQIRREAELRRQQEATLAQARAKVEEDRHRREADEQTLRKAQEDRDQAAYAKLLDQAKQLLARQKWGDAIAALQGAEGIRKTDEADRLLNQAREQQALAAAQQKSAEERAQLERKLAGEKAARDRTEAETKHKQDLYAQALQLAQKALADKHYDQAIAKYQEAGALFRTDAVLNGLHQAEAARNKERALANAERQKQDQEAEHQAAYRRLLETARADLVAKKYDAAIQALHEAINLNPGDRAAQAVLQEAENARAASLVNAHAQAEARMKAESYQKLLSEGRLALSGKQYDVALKEFREAQQLLPGDPAAPALIKEAEKAQNDARMVQEGESRKKQDASTVPPPFTPKPPGVQPPTTPARPKASVLTPPLSSATPPPTPATPPAKAVVAAPSVSPQPQPRVAVIPPTPPASPPPVVSSIQPKTPAGTPPSQAGLPSRAGYDKQMQAGAAFEKQQKYDEAVAAYQEALRLVPGDVRASASLQKAKFSLHMAKGKKAQGAKQYADAAKEFEDALKLTPGDPEAAGALQRARQGRP